MADQLNAEDVKRLLASPDAGVRAEIAGKIAAQHAHLTGRERLMAEDIFRVMVKDAEVRVREALSHQLKDSPLVPHDLAMALARDVESVAVPVLQFSEVLSEEDLIALVKSESSGKLQAMARRERVPTGVADALAESGDRKVVAALAANQGAELREPTLAKMVERYSGSDDEIGRALVDRRDLPVAVVEQLMTHVSEKIRAHLMARADLSPETASALLLQARELAVLGIAQSGGDVGELIDHLAGHDRLTPSIILRAVCMGDLVFFEAGLARLAGISVENARMLIHDKGKRGFAPLYQKAGLPPPLFQAMSAAIDVAADMKYDGGPNDRERFSRRMIERILTRYGEDGIEFKTDDLDYLLARMSQLPSSVVPEPTQAD